MSDQSKGYLALVLHGHLPFIRHPDQERFLEENWLYEAITECYLPMVEIMEGWTRDRMAWRLTWTLSPTLCEMLKDPLLQERYERYLNGRIELAEKEEHRTEWEQTHHGLAKQYTQKFRQLRDTYHRWHRDLVGAFSSFQAAGHLEIITSAATHALLPLLAQHPPSLRAQVMVGRDAYRECFGRDPRGFWLPECAYCEEVTPFLQEAGLRWFITDTHGVLQATPRPRYGVFAPVFTPQGVAAFGRDIESAQQVWSRQTGYPGDTRYREFYRDIGYDLDWEYVRPYLPSDDERGFTGIKYYAITGADNKAVYDRGKALQAAAEHAQHFLDQRMQQIRLLSDIMDRPPILVCPYDAELFGHWWYEGPEFLDYFMRKLIYDQRTVAVTTPWEYLQLFPSQQVATPCPSSWGENGYYQTWLNESNAWIYPHLHVAQERMSNLARNHPQAEGILRRAVQQAGRELLLAQSSDWPFIMRTGTHPQYARRRVTDHIVRFIALHEQLTATHVDEFWLERVEKTDNLFPNIRTEYWA